MNDQERQATEASANFHSRLGDLAFQQGWEAAMRYARGMAAYERMDDIDRIDMAMRLQRIRHPISG